MLTENENEVLLQLGVRFQLGALRYSDIKVKEIKNHNTQAFFHCSLWYVKIDILLTF